MNIPVNTPENPYQQMKENTKEFRKFFNILENSHYHREDCPYSCYSVISILIISITFIILIYNITNLTNKLNNI